jgi:hypothetical protein
MESRAVEGERLRVSFALPADATERHCGSCPVLERTIYHRHCLLYNRDLRFERFVDAPDEVRRCAECVVDGAE